MQDPLTFWGTAVIALSGVVHPSQRWTLTFTLDDNTATSFHYDAVFHSAERLTDTLGQVAAGLQAAIGGAYSASVDSAENLVVTRPDGKGFKVALVVTAAASTGTMTVSGTPLYYSTAKIHLTGPINSGETWAVTLNSTSSSIW